LISRWPVADGGPAMLLGFPKKFLKASTTVWISAGVTPDASNTCGAADAATGLKMSVKPKLAMASKSQCLFMIFMDCIGSVKIQVELLFTDKMNQKPFCSRQRKNLRPDHGRINDVVILKRIENYERA
jgi:hypothetical protein